MQTPHEDTTHYTSYHDINLPVIIMVHGFRGTHHGMDLIAQALPEFHVIVPDLPGFGEGAPLADEHSLANYVAWLYRFVQSLTLSSPPILLGHSFGSVIASSYARLYPQTISKLILVNPIGSPALEGPKALLTNLAIFYYWLGRKLPKDLARHWLAAKPIVLIMSVTMAKTGDKKTRAYIHDQHLQHFSTFASPKVVSEAFKASVSNSVLDHAAKITTATLLIAGDKDDITPLQKQQQLVRLFPNAILKVIKNVGHLTHYETPKEVAALIRQFID